MSKRDFDDALDVQALGASFNSLIMAAIGKADTKNFELMCVAWPELVEERRERYDNRGYLPIELPSEGELQ